MMLRVNSWLYLRKHWLRISLVIAIIVSFVALILLPDSREVYLSLVMVLSSVAAIVSQKSSRKSKRQERE